MQRQNKTRKPSCLFRCCISKQSQMLVPSIQNIFSPREFSGNCCWKRPPLQQRSVEEQARTRANSGRQEAGKVGQGWQEKRKMKIYGYYNGSYLYPLQTLAPAGLEHLQGQKSQKVPTHILIRVRLGVINTQALVDANVITIVEKNENCATLVMIKPLKLIHQKAIRGRRPRRREAVSRPLSPNRIHALIRTR